MKPEQFIRERGLDAVKDCIEEAEAYGGLYVNAKTLELSKHIPSYDAVSITALKDMATSVEIIELFESIEGAKDAHKNGLGFHSVLIGGYEIPISRLGDAVKDHESIYGGGDE